MNLLSAVSAVCLFAGLLLIVHGWEETSSTPAGAGREIRAGQDLTEYNGVFYRKKDGVETTLIMGVDKYEDGTGQGSYEQADFNLLLVVDRPERTYTVIHLNRDTMAEFYVLSEEGVRLGEVTGQLALAHAYGPNDRYHCENAVYAVSKLLNGTKINHYLSFKMDTVAVLNDLVGGVTLEVMDDMTDYDSALVQGETVTLAGEQATRYVRGRIGLADPSNLRRMERQRQYILAFVDCFARRAAEDDSFALSALLAVNDYIYSDCTAQQMAALMNDLQEYEMSGYLTPEGRAVAGERFAEFYLDEQALQEMLLRVFCVPV